MGRQRADRIRITPELVQRTADGVALTPEILREYVDKLRLQGRREDSVRGSEQILHQFFAALPGDGVIRRSTLSRWREALLAEGYAIRTANSKVSLINSLLESMDCREFQLSGQLKPERHCAPELTRQEYMQMLQTAKALEDRRGYLLSKLFATTGIGVIDLPRVTVEAVTAGHVRIMSGKTEHEIVFPVCLQTELLDYAREAGRIGGAVFVKRSGEPLARTQVSMYIQRLATDAGLLAEKGNVKCLRQLYRQTIAEIEANFELLVQQAYARQLEMEQLSVGWDKG